MSIFLGFNLYASNSLNILVSAGMSPLFPVSSTLYIEAFLISKPVIMGMSLGFTAVIFRTFPSSST